MNFGQILKKRPRLILYALIGILAILVSDSLGLNLYNMGPVSYTHLTLPTILLV